jgi:hypothetical protein
MGSSEGNKVHIDPIDCPLSQENLVAFQSLYHPFKIEEKDASLLVLHFVNALHFFEPLFLLLRDIKQKIT